MRPYFCLIIAGTIALQQMKGPSRLMRKHLAPFLEVGFPHRLVDAGDAGIVDEDVDLAERLQRRVARLFDRGEIGDVDLEAR